MISNSIVVGVDGSSVARSALRFAVDECQLRRRTLIVAHAADPADPMFASGGRPERAALDELGERLLRDHAAAASARQPGVPVTTRLLTAPTADALIEMSDRADLVVVGSRGRGGIVTSILGSVSHPVAAHARCPVVIVPEERVLRTQTLAPHIVVGLSPSHAGRLALDFALDEARLRRASLIAVRARDADHDAEPDDQLQSAADAYPDVVTKRTLVDSEPAEALLRAARSAQLLIVGGHHSDDRWSTRLGPVPSAIAHRSPCPVVIVGQRRHAAPDPDRVFVADFA